MEISIKKFNEIHTVELYEILRLRSEVFVVEQNCVYQDIDNKDQKALHVIGREEDKIVAYTRIFKGGDYFKNPSIGRVIVKKEYRKYGYGHKIIIASIEAIKNTFDAGIIELSAQTYLIDFYESHGFKKSGREYLEDGIPHTKMIRN